MPISRVSDVLQNGKAFIPFMTAGNSNLETMERLTPAMAEAGADLIEIGIPFSDPTAGGIMVQEADMRALTSGTAADRIFEMVRRIRGRMDTPLAFMTYINPIFVYGAERFPAKYKECRIDALIVPDTPFEKKQELLPYCHRCDIEPTSLIVPISKERIAAIARGAEGFVYCVSSMGVTGVRVEITMDTREMVPLVKRESGVPCAIGFGISIPEQVKKMAAPADGAIAGSTIIRIVAQYGTGCVAPICDYIRAMEAAISWHGHRYIIIPVPVRLICQ